MSLLVVSNLYNVVTCDFSNVFVTNHIKNIFVLGTLSLINGSKIADTF